MPKSALQTLDLYLAIENFVLTCHDDGHFYSNAEKW